MPPLNNKTSSYDLPPLPPPAQQSPVFPSHSSFNNTKLESIGSPELPLHNEGGDWILLKGHPEDKQAPKAILSQKPREKPKTIVFTSLPNEGEIPISSHVSSGEPQLEESQMGRKSRKSPSQDSDRATSTASGGQNGHAQGDMDSRLEMRRKNPSLDSPTAASQTAHLMSRESFTLDDEPPLTTLNSNVNSSFFELPRQDRRNFLLLVLLYFLQGIPMGLAAGSVPFLLKSHLSYGQIGVFSLATYPYSLKLLWSPIVDAVWHPKLGRRKSWILPIQMCSGFGMIYLGGRIKEMMIAAGASDGSGVWTFTWWWFFLVFLCATQDIAVDGKQYFLRKNLHLLTFGQVGRSHSYLHKTSRMLPPLKLLGSQPDSFSRLQYS